MNKRNKKQKLKEFRKHVKTIRRKTNDKISIAEAKLLLHTLIFHFNGFARQQQLVNEYMSYKYHWGNKRTASVLKFLSDIGIIDRTRSGHDNWTLFFLVKGFLKRCMERIESAKLAIRERVNCFRSAIFSATCVWEARTKPRIESVCCLNG